MSKAAYLPIVADRYGACVRHLFIEGMDLTGVQMRAQVRFDGDTPGTPLVDLLTVTNGSAEGLRLVEVATNGDGLPTSHVEIVINESTMESLPYSGEIGDATRLRWDMQITLSGRKRRLARGDFEITGDGVTGAEVAPLNRPQSCGRPRLPVSNPWSAARLSFGEEQVTVKIVDAELVAPLAKAAKDDADRSEANREGAELAAATALASGRYFPTRAAGEAASVADQLFSTDDGAGALIYYRRTSGGSVEIGRALTPSGLASGAGASKVGFRGSGTGEQTIDTATLLQTAVDVRRFGAKCDGVTDDTAAVQRWLDHLTAGTQSVEPYSQANITNTKQPRAGVVTGKLRITAQLIIKQRKVDRTSAPLRIHGMGQGAGFYVEGNFKLFECDVVVPSFPSAEFVYFQDIMFWNGDPANAAVCFSSSWLRMHFVGCWWWQIPCLESDRYAQEWVFERPTVRGISTNRAFFTALGAYAIRSVNGKYQNSFGGIYRLVHPVGEYGVVGCSFTGDTYESNGGSFLTAGQCQGVSVVGMYSEGNSAPILDFRCSPGGKNKGISLTGCEFNAIPAKQANPSFYNIIWGPGGGASSGNTSSGNLHDNALRSSGGRVLGCNLHELKADDRMVGTGKLYAVEIDTQNGLSPSSTEARPGTLITASQATFTAVDGPLHTASLPSPLPGMVVTVMNRTSSTFRLYPSPISDGAKYFGGNANVEIEFPAVTRRTFSCTETGIWDY